MPEVTVEEFFSDQQTALRLDAVAGLRDVVDKRITVPDLHRPGLAFAAYFDYFAAERLQVVGRTELSYLETLSEKRRAEILGRYFSFPLCCVVVTQGMTVPPDFVAHANERSVPLLQTQLATTKFISLATVYLEDKMAPMLALHGTLLDVAGVGVLLLGPSGIGKSECALDLIDRGHRLVADDVVEIRRLPDGTLMGGGSPLIKGNMEIRGVGVINVRDVFGIAATREQKWVEFVAVLEEWQDGKEYDRLGLDERTHPILDIPLPAITIPVRPGRHLAVIIEVAAMNLRLKRTGRHAARELGARMTEWMRAQHEAG